MSVSTTPAIFSHFEDLTDPRMDRTKLHLLTDMVSIALCAAICGSEGWADVERFGNMKRAWFARFLELLERHPIARHVRPGVCTTGHSRVPCLLATMGAVSWQGVDRSRNSTGWQDATTLVRHGIR